METMRQVLAQEEVVLAEVALAAILATEVRDAGRVHRQRQLGALVVVVVVAVQVALEVVAWGFMARVQVESQEQTQGTTEAAVVAQAD